MSPCRAARARTIALEVLRVRRRGSLPARYVYDQAWRVRHVHQPAHTAMGDTRTAMAIWDHVMGEKR